MEITKQLPSVAMVKGWTKYRTKNHIQFLLPPFSNEFSAVNLEGKTEQMTTNAWQINVYSMEKGEKSMLR